MKLTKAQFHRFLDHLVLPAAPLFCLLYPVLMCFLFEFSLFEDSTLVIALGWGAWATLAVNLCGRWLNLAICSLLLPIGLLEVFHLVAIGAPVSEASIHVILESNLNETMDFVDMSFSWVGLLAALLFLVGALFILRLDHRLLKKAARPLVRQRMLLLSLIVIMFLFNLDHQRHFAFPRPIASVITYVQEIREYRRVLGLRRLAIGEELFARSLYPEKEEVHVLVIGESLNRNHMSLYGYSRETNPLLKKQNDLLIYRDVISPFSNTLSALRVALTSLTAESTQKIYEAYSLIDYARASGYETSWLSNQSPLGIYDNSVALLGSTADRTVFVNLSGEMMKAFHSVSLDEKLLPQLKKSLAGSKKKHLIILHLMGAHVAYAKRYPVEFANFKLHKSDREEIIDHYDNAVLYNDRIVSDVIDQLRQYSQRNPSRLLTMTYFSDHGEEVFDTQSYYGHARNNSSRHNFEIPYLLWVSSSYRQAFPDKYLQMQKSLEAPYKTDDYLHSFLDMAHIETADKDPSKSLYSPLYKIEKRVLTDVDYQEPVDYQELRARTTEKN